MKLFLNRLRSPRAETLAEAVISITVLGIGAGGIMIMLNSAIRANDIGQERVVALNLAQEGVAAVETLRDTNWLRFPGNREECWDVLDATSAAECDDSTTTHLATTSDINGKTYVVYRELGSSAEFMTWGFENLATYSPSTSLTLEEVQTLAAYEIGTGGPTLLSHALGGNAALTSTPTVGNYGRTVTVVKSTTVSPDDTLQVTATVTWTSRGQDHSVNFSGTLYNFL